MNRDRTVPRTAMVLAAGLGVRMRPLTDTTAKVLLPLGGRALIDHALDRLAAAGVELVVVNTHWQADKIEKHLRGRSSGPEIVLRHEETLLDTGGSVRAALPLLGPGPFYVVNGDTFWLDGPVSALQRLAGAFDRERLDGVLLVHRAFQVQAEVGFGDFAVDKWGTVRRRGEREVVPYIYAGVQVIAPSLVARMAERPARSAFSMNACWDRAIERGRLTAVVHDGLWFHLSTPRDLSEAESWLAAGALGETR